MLSPAALPPMETGHGATLGATVEAGGVRVAVFSEHATRIELCLFDDAGVREVQRLDLHGPHDGLWHGCLPGAGAGLVYGLRAHGPYEPGRGHRSNPHKLLLDPCAREIVGRHRWRPEHHGYVLGQTADPAIGELRARVRPAMLATLLLAQGMPMLNAGDEIGNSQQGNNNAWTQDNPTGWLGWDVADEDLCAFVAEVLALRRAEPGLRQDDWFTDEPAPPDATRMHWTAPAGRPMTAHDWRDSRHHAFACHIGTGERDGAVRRGLLVAFNPEDRDCRFALPPGPWMVALDSARVNAVGQRLQDFLSAPAHALVVLRTA